jgi:hypothetical protein
MRVGPGGQLRDDVDLAEKLADHLTGVVSLAERVEIGEEPFERIFGLRNRDIRIVLALQLEMSMVLQNFFPKEVAETLTRRSAERNVQGGDLGTLEATFQGHR